MSSNEAAVNPNKVLWEKGDFGKIAAVMRKGGQTLVDSLGVTRDMRVLDLGCGDGTTALPLARTGAEVVGIDIARNLVEAGNKRAQVAGLTNLSFHEGDACNLAGVADDSFDLVLSVFGAMFAPQPFAVAKEVVRVAKPGGRVVMGNWIPGDPTYVAQMFQITSAYSPPTPEGFISPMMWGLEDSVLERFGQAGIPPERVSMRKDTFIFDSPDHSPERMVDIFRNYFGPVMNAFACAQSDGEEQRLYDELLDLSTKHNQSKQGGILIPATFMRVEVSV